MPSRARGASVRWQRCVAFSLRMYRRANRSSDAVHSLRVGRRGVFFRVMSHARTLKFDPQVEYDLVQGPKGFQASNLTGPGGRSSALPRLTTAHLCRTQAALLLEIPKRGSPSRRRSCRSRRWPCVRFLPPRSRGPRGSPDLAPCSQQRYLLRIFPIRTSSSTLESMPPRPTPRSVFFASFRGCALGRPR